MHSRPKVKSKPQNLKENMGEKKKHSLYDFSKGNISEIRYKKNVHKRFQFYTENWKTITCIKIKIFHVTNDPVNIVKRPVMAWEEMSAMYTQQRIQIRISCKSVRKQ